jgi:hypothetical protein
MVCTTVGIYINIFALVPIAYTIFFLLPPSTAAYFYYYNYCILVLFVLPVLSKLFLFTGRNSSYLRNHAGC